MGQQAARLRRACPHPWQGLRAQVPQRRQAALAHHRSARFAVDARGSPQGGETASGGIGVRPRPGQPRGGATVAEGVEAFIDAHCRHLRTGNEITWLLRKHVVGKWGDRRLTSIGQGDVVQLLRDVQGDDRTKRVRIANRVRMVLESFFRWAIAEAMVPTRENPVSGTEPRRGEIKRERVLTDKEIAAVWKAADGGPFGAIVRLLLITGQRRGEVGGMHWSELDLEGRVWRIPEERSKGEREHQVPLNDLAWCKRVRASKVLMLFLRQGAKGRVSEDGQRRNANSTRRAVCRIGGYTTCAGPSLPGCKPQGCCRTWSPRCSGTRRPGCSV